MIKYYKSLNTDESITDPEQALKECDLAIDFEHSTVIKPDDDINIHHLVKKAYSSSSDGRQLKTVLQSTLEYLRGERGVDDRIAVSLTEDIVKAMNKWL